MRRGIASLLCAAAFAGAPAMTAEGLSCAAIDPRHDIERMDAAFVGTLVSSRAVWSGTVITATVETDLRDNLDETVTYLSRSWQGDGFFMRGSAPPVGARVATALHLGEHGWTAGSCSRLEPDDVERAMIPFPRARPGEARAVVTGQFGEISAIALDGAGRVRGYGGDAGYWYPAMCPGSAWMAGVSSGAGAADLHLIRRELRSMRASAQPVDLPFEERTSSVPGFVELSCIHRRARDVVGLSQDDNGTRAVVTLVTPSDARVLLDEDVGGSTLHRSGAYVVDETGRLVRVAVPSGARTVLGRIPARTRALAVSPRADRIATIERSGAGRARLVVRPIDRLGEVIAAWPIRVRGDGGVMWQRVAWIDDARVSHVGGEHVDLYGVDTGYRTRLAGARDHPVRLGEDLLAIHGGPYTKSDVRRYAADGSTETFLSLPAVGFSAVLTMPATRIGQTPALDGLAPPGPRFDGRASYGLDMRLAGALALAAPIVMIGLLAWAVRSVRRRRRGARALG